MKRLILIIAWMVPFVILAQETTLYEPANYKWAVKNGTRSRDGNPGPDYWQNHADYDIAVRLDTAEKRIYGRESVTYYNQSPDTLTSIVIRLYQNRYKEGAIRDMVVHPGNIHEGMDLDTMIISGQGIEFNSDRVISNGTNLFISLEHPLPPDGNLNLYCEWSYKIPVEPEFRRTGHYKDNSWFIGYFYPQIAVYDDMEISPEMKGWDYILFHKGNEEFYNDFNNYKVSIEVPEDFYVWATGDLINKQDIYSQSLLERLDAALNSEETVHIIAKDDLNNNLLTGNVWKFEANEVTDFGFGAALNYLWDATGVLIDDRRVFVDVAYHPESIVYPEVIDIARKTVKYASEVFPGIPFPYNHTTTFNGMLSGGMEFPMIANNSDVNDSTFMTLMTFHEICHNYLPFMMGINEKRYHFLDEGITQFITIRFLWDQYLLDFYSDNSASNYMSGIYDVYSDLCVSTQDNSSLYQSYAHTDESNIFYQYLVKSVVPYMLFAEMIGEDKFIYAFKEFCKRWKGKHPTPYDFFYTMNNILKENYNWFWKAWFLDPGYPDLGLYLSGQNVIVKRVGEGSLPLPVRLQILYNDGSLKHIERPMDIWKNGIKEIKIKLDQFENINEISLDTELIPDIDLSNNSIVNTGKAQSETSADKYDTDNLVSVSFDSHGSKLRGYFSKALGDGPHPTIILLHGSPGGDRDVLGLAQEVPKAGWNALVFTYRGFYESEGISSPNNSVEDVFSAINFLRSDEIANKYSIDVNNTALAGWSYGGGIALTAAAGDPSIKYVISIAAADLSAIARMAEKNEEFRSMFIETMNDRYINGPVKGTSGEEALQELITNADKYDLVKHAGSLADKSILIIGGWNDQASTLEGHVLPLIRALQLQGAKKVDKVILDSNHSFEGKKDELANVVIKWLKDHHPRKME